MPLIPGSIAFVGFNADGNDNIAFVALTDIAAGETLIFEDNEWNGTAFNDTNEGAFSWTANSNVSAGTVIRIDNIGSGVIAASVGSASTPVDGRGTNRGIGGSDETIYVYQGSAAAPTFITAVGTGGFNASNGVLTGTGLTAGVNALDLSIADEDLDIAAYAGARSGEADFASYAALINNPANWIAQDGSGDQSADSVAPDLPFDAAAFTVGAAPPPPPANVLGGITILPMAESLQGSVDTPVANESVNIVRKGGYISGDGVGGAESIAFDPTSAKAYVTNAQMDRIDILDLADPSAPVKSGFIDLAVSLPGFNYGAVNSVAVRNGLVAVAVQNADGGENGVVALFDGATGQLIKSIEVGVLPDHVTFNRDGTLLLVANEGERFLDLSGTPAVENAPGTVTVISIPENPADASVRNTIGFSALDAFESQLDALGVKTYDGGSLSISDGAFVGSLTIPDSTVSQDLEPEYVAISPDGTRAFVTLQEANAVAVIDLTDASADKPVSILPLGFVDFSLPGNEADFSDRDGPGNSPSISVGNAPIKGLLQPDAIASFEVAGTTYFITANEGDSRILSSSTFDDPALNEARASAVSSTTTSDYARVNVDTVWSSANDLYAFGGRGFSIFRANEDGSIVKVEETGGDFDQIFAALPNASTVFNGLNGGEFDSRSDNKGGEPEGVVVGEVDGKMLAFVGMERIGGLMVWDVSNPENAQFVRYVPPTSQDYGPEVLTFVSAENSPSGRALVLAANEVTGSVTVYEASSLTTISEIQGAGAVSPLVGKTVTVEAIVVGDFQNGDADGARNLGGFYLQEEVVDQDGNALTSEGIFVSQGALPGDVQLGDRVRVTGVVTESFGNTEINATVITVTQAGAVADVNTLAVDIDLPAAGVQGVQGSYSADLEAFEGMLVRIPETLTVTEQFNFDRFGEARLTAGERPESFTVSNDPSIAGFDAHLRDVAARSIIFDDGRSIQNPNLDNILTDGVYNTASAPRMGDTVTGLTGVLDFDFSQYRIHAVQNGPGVNDFTSANPRPTTAPEVGGSVKVASFNVLNYFVTLDDGASTANGFEPRGAETPEEFARQTEKLVDAIIKLDADILGLVELENNFLPGDAGNAIEFLVSQLNTAAGGVAYSWIDPGQQFVGGDAIAVGFIFKPDVVRVSLNTTIAVLDDASVSPDLLAQSTIGGIFNGEDTSRAALAVTFEEIASGGDFTAVVNHFKSKSGAGIDSDANQLDGAGGWNQQRALASQALLDWLETNPTGSDDPDVMILGDLNAYAKEDPIDVLKDAGFVDQAANSHSYVFDGQTGSLDYALTNASLSAQVAGAAHWSINADEADALDYQLNFGRNPAIFNGASPVRSSDHDPIVVGLNLKGDIYTLQLLHLADAEAGLLASKTAKNLAAMIDAFEDDYENTIILSGGDNFIPGPFLSAGTDPSVIPTLNQVSGSTIGLTSTVPIGAVDTAILNAMGVQVSAIGNHEFDLGSNAFAGSFVPGSGWVGANYAMVSANLDFSGDSALNPRFTQTMGNGVTPTAEASTLKGRIAPAVVITEGGEKIGIVGATTQIVEAISSPSGTEVKGFPTGPGANGEVDDMVLLAAQLQPIIDELRAEGVNKIVLQAHLQNINNEKQLATLLKGVDIILAAGSNTRLGDADDEAVAFPGHAANFADTYPLVITDAEGGSTLIVNTDNEFTYLGRLKVDFDKDGNIILDNLVDDVAINGAYASTAENVAKAWGVDVADLETTAFADGTKGDQVRDLTDAVQNVIASKDGNVFGFTDVYLEGERLFVRSQETNLGSLSADANAHAYRKIETDDDVIVVALKNGGGIRAQIGTLSAPDPVDGTVDKLPPPANPDAGKLEGGVSQLDIENSLRFNNRLMAFDTTPEGLKALLEHGVAAGTGQGRFPQIGGVAFSWDPDNAAGSRVSDIAVFDAQGSKIALFDDGVLVDGAPTAITVVTLNFLANGGDGYPMKANGENFRYLLDNGTLSAPVDESLDFTSSSVIATFTPSGVALLGEQQALAEFMEEFHATPEEAYDVADTPVELDERIQNVNFREDTVLEGAGEPVEILASALAGQFQTDQLFAVLTAADLNVEGDAEEVVYTLDTLPAGAMLVNGAFAKQGTQFTQADINAGRVILFAAAVAPTAAGENADDGFSFTVSNGSREDAGSFVATYEAFAAVGSAGALAFGTFGDDYLTGTDAVNRFILPSGADTIDAGGGADIIASLLGATRVFGGAGADRITTGFGDDLVDGGEDNDIIQTGLGNDIVFGGGGNDRITIQGGDNIVFGGSGNDTIQAGAGDDVIDGGLGNDTIRAGSGANTYILGGIPGENSDGNDTYSITRDSGAGDMFVLFLEDAAGNAVGFGNDTVDGFRISQGDRLVAFGDEAGDWDDAGKLLEFAQSDAVRAFRSSNGQDLRIEFADGQANESSITLARFYNLNSTSLSTAELATASGQELADDVLAGILQDIVEDGQSAQTYLARIYGGAELMV